MNNREKLRQVLQEEAGLRSAVAAIVGRPSITVMTISQKLGLPLPRAEALVGQLVGAGVIAAAPEGRGYDVLLPAEELRAALGDGPDGRVEPIPTSSTTTQSTVGATRADAAAATPGAESSRTGAGTGEVTPAPGESAASLRTGPMEINGPTAADVTGPVVMVRTDQGGTRPVTSTPGLTIRHDVDPKTIQVDPEFRDLITPPRPEERAGQEASIREHGCLDALVTWNDLLVDGHGRRDICEQLGLRCKVIELDLPDRTAAKIWILSHQLHRRNLTDDQRALLAERHRQLMSEAAVKERAIRGGEGRAATAARDEAGRMVAPSLSDNVTDKLAKPAGQTQAKNAPKGAGKKCNKKDTRADAAKQANVSERKLRQAQQLAAESPDLAKAVERGDMSLKAALKELKGQQASTSLDSHKAPVAPVPQQVSSQADHHTPNEAEAVDIVQTLRPVLARAADQNLLDAVLSSPGGIERAKALVIQLRQVANQWQKTIRARAARDPGGAGQSATSQDSST